MPTSETHAWPAPCRLAAVRDHASVARHALASWALRSQTMHLSCGAGCEREPDRLAEPPAVGQDRGLPGRGHPDHRQLAGTPVCHLHCAAEHAMQAPKLLAVRQPAPWPSPVVCTWSNWHSDMCPSMHSTSRRLSCDARPRTCLSTGGSRTWLC